MKQLGMLHANDSTIDGALHEVIALFNIARRDNKTMEYRDIDITVLDESTFFTKRAFVLALLIYEYEELHEEEIQTEEVYTKRFISTPAGIDPADPNWREKLEAARTAQDGR